jgi:hypothetical protein
LKVPFKRVLAYEADRWGRAIGVVLLFIAVLVLPIALSDWANGLQPWWLSTLVKVGCVIIAGVSIGLFFTRAPQRF